MASTNKNDNKINQLISENIEDIIFICNENLECEYNNKKELDSKKSLVDYIHPQDSKQIIKFIENAFKFGYRKEEYRIIGDNNLFKWYEIKGKRFIDDDKNNKVFLICRDITRLKNLEAENKKGQIRYTQLADTLPEINYWKLLQSKESITAVQKTREMLEVVINNIPQLIYWKDTKLVYLGCNTKFATINDLINPHSILGRTDDDLKWVINKLDYIKECENSVIRKNEPEYNVIELLITPDGKQTWYEINRIPLHDSSGNAVGILVTYEDISIRKFSEQKLKESEEKYRHLVENIPDAVYSALPDETGSTTFMSNRWKDWTGYFPEDFYNDHETWTKSMHPEDRDGTIKKYINAFKEKTEYTLEYRVVHKETGEIRYVRDRGVPNFDEKGNVSRFDGVVSDITESEEAEQQLRESEEKYRGILENIEETYFEVDLGGTFTFFNDAFFDLFGFLKEEIMGVNYQNFVDEENQHKIRKVYREVYETEQPKSGFEFHFRNKSGELVTCESSVYLRYDSDGNKIGFSGLARNITEKYSLERKYRHLFVSSPYSIILIDKKGIIVDANPVTEKIFGRSVEDLINKNFLEVRIKPENILPLFKERYSAILDGQVPEPMEVQILRSSDNQAIWVHIDDTLVEIGGETVFQVIIQDVTDQKNAEQELRNSQEELRILNKELEKKVRERTDDLIDSERQYRTTINSLGDPLHVVNRDLRIILVNQALKKWLGELNLNIEIIGKKISEAFTFLPPKIYDEYEQVFDTRMTLITMESTQLPDNEVLTETRKIPIFNEGKVDQVITIIRDVTESREMERQLKISEEKYRNVVKNLDIGFYKGEYRGKLLMHNQALNKIVGLKPDESIVGLESTKFFVDTKRLEKYYSELQENGFVKNFVAEIKKFNGSIVVVDINAHLIYNSEGNAIEIEGTFADITEKFKLQQDLLESEKKLRKQNLELLKLDEVKNDFITMAAHELKTPLISISGYTDYILMKHRNRLTPEITEDLKTVQRNVTRLEVLMDQLLEVMKIDENKLKLQKERVNVSKIVNNCLDELSYLINEKNLEVILNIDREILLSVDPTRIFTVFTNLISNAIKFTPDYGWIEISGEKVENMYVFEVKDNGIGLAEDEISRLFMKFERIKPPVLSKSSNIKDSGTGLGLYITKGIVNAHNGEIRANSNGLDKGTTLSFSLPI